jgi:hypothetical protein
MKNTGKSLERAVKGACEWYRLNGIAIIDRIEPPQAFDRGADRFIATAPSRADFIGTWTNGQAVYVECKSMLKDVPKKGILARTLFARQWDRLEPVAAMGANVVLVAEIDHGNGPVIYAAEWVDHATATMDTFRFTPNLHPCGTVGLGFPDFLNTKERA